MANLIIYPSTLDGRICNGLRYGLSISISFALPLFFKQASARETQYFKISFTTKNALQFSNNNQWSIYKIYTLKCDPRFFHIDVIAVCIKRHVVPYPFMEKSWVIKKIINN